MLLLVVGASARANVKMPAIFGDHMVLQQGASLPVWGRAEGGETVTVSIAGREARTVADERGRWKVKLETLPASSQPLTLQVQGKNCITFQDVLVGDVWVCSGQSNMEFGIQLADNAKEAVSQANVDKLRLFVVAHNPSLVPQEDCAGQWVVCSPQTVASFPPKGFSAVAYFFGSEILRVRKNPVGLIETCWSATPAQPWTPLEALRKDPRLAQYANQIDSLQANLPQLKEKYEKETLPNWEAKRAAWQQEVANWEESVKQARLNKTTPPVRPANLAKEPWHQPAPDANPLTATCLFNGMVHPLIPYGIKGVIWYQGESNSDTEATATEYRALLPALISGWREAWAQGDFPFLYVQLANWESDKALALLRDAQLKTLALPNTGMAVAIDLGERNNIHPKNKLDVGKRLALAARKVAYGEDVVFSGPIYTSMKVEGNSLRLFFKQIGGGLTIGAPPVASSQPPQPPANSLRGFEIAGRDGKFVAAEAKIEGDSIIVRSAEVGEPSMARYGWASFPEVNLYNKEGLPTSPFATNP